MGRSKGWATLAFQSQITTTFCFDPSVHLTAAVQLDSLRAMVWKLNLEPPEARGHALCSTYRITSCPPSTPVEGGPSMCRIKSPECEGSREGKGESARGDPVSDVAALVQAVSRRADTMSRILIGFPSAPTSFFMPPPPFL